MPSRRPLPLAPFLAALVGCGPSAPAPQPPLIVLPPATSAATATVAAAEPERPPALCGKRATCKVRKVRAAGADATGKKLAVVTLDLGVQSEVEGEAPPPAGDDIEETDREDTTSRLAMNACHRFEYWLTVEGSDRPPQLLAVACNDGYGASGVGEDIVKVGDNAFTHTQSGGSSWRWSWTHEISLAPLRFKSSLASGSWNVSVNTQASSWDWATFQGHESWYAPPCDADGQPPQDPKEGTPYASVLVPRVAIDEAFRAGGFRTAGLGACAADVDGTGARGFLTYGGKGDRASASLRAVLSDHDELFVEVRDAMPSGTSARWVADDHLEIWLAPQRGEFGDQCLPKREAPKQWGVRVADGQVFAGYGKPSPGALHVERADAGGGVVRFKIGLPARQGGITIAYSKGDGKKQQRVFATSQVKRNAPETLGSPFVVPPTRAVCKVQGGSLEPVITRQPSPDKPFADEQL